MGGSKYGVLQVGNRGNNYNIERNINTYVVKSSHTTRSNQAIAIADPGAKIHIGHGNTLLKKKMQDDASISASIPNVINIYPKQIFTLTLTLISTTLNKIQISPYLKLEIIIYIGAICDNECTCTLKNRTLRYKK